MKKFKLIGLTDNAERYLSVEDFEELSDMIGCEVEEIETRCFIDGKMLLKMPDGQDTHIDFLELEEIQPKLFN